MRDYTQLLLKWRDQAHKRICNEEKCKKPDTHYRAALGGQLTIINRLLSDMSNGEPKMRKDRKAKMRFLSRIDFDQYLERFSKKTGYRKKAWCHFIREGKVKCALSGIEATHVKMVQYNDGSIHWDFYTDDDQMMTLDHIKPKKLGGTNNIKNLQPMLLDLNSRKGHSLTYEKKYLERVEKKQIEELPQSTRAHHKKQIKDSGKREFIRPMFEKIVGKILKK